MSPAHVMNLFDYADTREAARDGMYRAAEHADQIEPRWSERALSIIYQYALSHPEFMAEDVRIHAHRVGLPKPPDPRAWGAVVNSAVRDGILVRDRYELTKIPPAHATPRPVWKSLVYRRSA